MGVPSSSILDVFWTISLKGKALANFAAFSRVHHEANISFPFDADAKQPLLVGIVVQQLKPQ